MSAIAGSRFWAVSNVPVVHSPVRGSWVAPSERGKNSYQAPYRARSRSTSHAWLRLAVTKSRSGRACISARTSGEVPAVIRASAGRLPSRSACTASRRVVACSGVRGTSAIARSSTRAPSSSISSVSTSAATLIVASCSHVA